MPQVPPVGNLDRLRQRVPHGLGVRGRAVPAHGPHSRMSAQPLGDGRGAPAREHVDPLAGIGIDQHGGVGPATAQGEVVDPQHTRDRTFRQRDAQQRPHRGVPPRDDPKDRQQAGRRTAGKLANNAAQLPGQPDRAPLIALQQPRDLLPERLPRTPG
ncbi:hypothetical protein GCM10023081_39220 [Arthrobacter ginkgonis]|uniref:Uncharacterized protein n=1 Tax=Arthrobacter ginkgonis TaxID=1630594 RepID=A0ABP7D2A0_9MICC